MKMSLARALKEKKRLVTENADLWRKICNENGISLIVNSADVNMSSDEFNAKYRHSDIKALLAKYLENADKLIALKTLITTANVGIAEQLVKLSEYKATLVLLKDFCTGYNEASVYNNNDCYRVANYVINTNDKDALIAEYVAKVNEMQDEIDAYNATTYIELA